MFTDISLDSGVEAYGQVPRSVLLREPRSGPKPRKTGMKNVEGMDTVHSVENPSFEALRCGLVGHESTRPFTRQCVPAHSAGACRRSWRWLLYGRCHVKRMRSRQVQILYPMRVPVTCCVIFYCCFFVTTGKVKRENDP